MNTHSAFGVTPDGSFCFIDGIPDTCDHTGPHDDVFQSSSGKMIYWHTYRQWASYTAPMRNQLIQEHHESIDDPIVMGTSQCRKCKKVFYPSQF